MLALVLLVVLLSVGAKSLSLLSSLLSLLISSLLELLQELSVSSLLLLNVLGDNSIKGTKMRIRQSASQDRRLEQRRPEKKDSYVG